VHPDEDLARTGDGIGPFLDVYLLVGDHERAHAADGSGRAALRCRAVALPELPADDSTRK